MISHTNDSFNTAVDDGVARGHFQISADGRFAVFTAEQIDSCISPFQIFLCDLTTRKNILVSHHFGNPSAGGNEHSHSPSISADGRRITYESTAVDLIDGHTDTNNDGIDGSFDVNDDGIDIFVYDRLLGKTLLVSRTEYDANKSGNGESYRSLLAADGKRVVFLSYASDLITGDYNRRADVFSATIDMGD